MSQDSWSEALRIENTPEVSRSHLKLNHKKYWTWQTIEYSCSAAVHVMIHETTWYVLT